MQILKMNHKRHIFLIVFGLYKEYYRDGKLIKREEIRHETYQPQQGIVIEGAQELPEGFVLPEQDVVIYEPNN